MSKLDLADRYGASKNLALPLSIIAAILGIAWLLWAAAFHSTPEIKTNVISYNATSGNEIALKFQVIRKDESKKFTCTLTGSDINHFIVGEIQRVIGPGERIVSVVIPTRSTAAFAKVVGCTS